MKKAINLCFALFFLLTIASMTSCQKDDPNQSSTGEYAGSVKSAPVVTTISASSNSSSTAIVLGSVDAWMYQRGVVWSTSMYPTLANSKTTAGQGIGTFTGTLTNLLPSTTYYVRAYATNSSNATMYGDQKSFTTLPTVSDIDGNVYETVQIGTQTWMKQNLKTTHYRNGNAIPNVTNVTSWTNQVIGAYCDYSNNPSNSIIYGRLYNFYAVIDSRNICPIGWHIPSDQELTLLTSFLGGESAAGGSLKESGTNHWNSPNTGGSNSSYFTALPAGQRGAVGSDFGGIGSYAYFWSSTIFNHYSGVQYAWSRRLVNLSSEVSRQFDFKQCGFSIRCIKD